jgi:hypothetical protein
MESQLDLQIRDQLVRYLGKEISLKEFRNWFDASTWDMERSGANRDAMELAGEIELRLSEFSNGHWTEEELRNKLMPLVETYAQTEQSWGQPNVWFHTSSSSVTERGGITELQAGGELGSRADIQAVVEYV